MKTLRLLLLLVFSLTIAKALAFASTQYISKEIPLRFTFDRAGKSVMYKESPSIPAGLLTSIKAYVGGGGYVGSGGVPIQLSIPGRLTIECPKDDIFPGNQVICRAWIQSEDDPSHDELSSDYGAEFGIKVVTEDFFFGKEYEIGDFGYDFLFKIRANGKMPLGDNFLCDMDTVDFFSLPIEEFIPGSSEAGKLIKTLLNINSSSGGYDIMALDLAAEMVIEGKKVILMIDGKEVEFTGFRDSTNYPDPSTDPNVKEFTIYIPIDVDTDLRYDWASKSMIYDPIIQYEFNGYHTIGTSFTLIPGISFNILPELITKGKNPFQYSCPSPSTLHNSDFYEKFAENFRVSNNIPISISLPLTDSPNLPDVAITNVYINGKPGEEKAYVGEKTHISFDITNLGIKETSQDPFYKLHLDCFGGQPHFNFSVYLDGQPITTSSGDPIEFRRVDMGTNWWNVCDAEPIILGVNESVNISGIEHQFDTEGMHRIEIKIAHSEYKGTADGKPVYALGDSNRSNNKVTLYLNVLPPRGTVYGHLQLNPCTPDCGVDGIEVCLRDISSQAYNECTTSNYDNVHGHGFFSFGNVPTGDYRIEILPVKPSDSDLQQGAPFWAPRMFSFHHEGDNSDDLTFSLMQYQTVTGKVIDNTNSSPISGVEVALGEFGSITSTTDSDGNFSLKYFMPGREYRITLKHLDYQTKQMEFLVFPWTSADTVQNLGSMQMVSDTSPPSINMKPLPNSGFFTNILNFSFTSYDNDKATYQYRYIIMNSSGQTIYTSPWQAYLGTTPDSYIDISHSMQNLNDGIYKFKVEAKDHKDNTIVSPETTFTKDTTAPQLTITLSDPVTGSTQSTDKKAIDIGLTISNSEPGPLSLYLSKDGQNWNYVTSFVADNPGYTMSVKNWEFVLEDVYLGSKTVYAKLVDMASNQATASDAIDVDTTGAIKLAGGSPYWYTTNVLLDIGITPPPGNLLFGEWGMGGETNVGDAVGTQHLAQKIVLEETKTFNVIHFFMAENTAVVGTPGPLHIQLVHNLLNSDPKSSQNPNNVIKEWVLEEGDVRYLTAKYIDYIPLYLEPAIVLNPGTYFLVLYSETVSTESYYRKPTGYYSMYQPTPQNHMRLGYNAGENKWVEVKTDTEIWTLSYQAYYSPEGSVKIALDGNCDNPQWSFEDFKKNFMINLPHDGLNTVCVEYYNSLNNTKNKKYYSSIIIDTTKPSGQVAYTFSKDSKTYTFNFSASSDVQYIKFSLPNGYQKLLPMAPSISIGPAINSDLFSQIAYFDIVNFSFIDRAWNESPTYTVQIGQQDDIFNPIIQLSISGDNQYTNSVSVSVHIYAEDSFGLSEIKLKELITGKEYAFSANGKIYSEFQVIDLPEVDLSGTKVVLDGTYKIVAQAKDTNGNIGHTIIPLKITLDREPPKIQNIKLTSTDGKDYTVSPDVLLTMTLESDMSPLFYRYRFEPNGQWTNFTPIQKGSTSANLMGYTPLPEEYEITVQVLDAAGNLSQKTSQIKVNRKPVINSINLSSLNDLTPIISVNCQDPDLDDIPVASFTIKKQDASILYSTGTIQGLYFEVPPGFLSYNNQYGVVAQVFDSYGLASNYFVSYFTITKPKLTVDKLGDGNNKVTSSDGAIDCGSICEKEYDFGTVVTLHASASEGVGFTGWSGDCSNCAADSSCSVTVNKDTLCHANFAKLGTITINSGEGGSISCSPNPVPYKGASSCSIIPKEGHHVVDVTVDGVSKGPISTYTFDNVTSNHTIQAAFEINKYNITTSASPSGSGALSCAPNPVSHGSTSNCTITPYTGYHITDVKVDGESKGAISQFSFSNVTSDHKIDAFFAVNKYKITASANPSVGGSISCNPVEVDYNSNSTCTITTNTNYILKDVQGTCGGSLKGNIFSTNPIVGDCTVVAAFEKISYTFNVDKKGQGSGVIISSPAGINCGSDCTETYQTGTQVTLTAQPNASSEFADWTGNCLGTSKEFQLTMDQDKSCTATFNLKYYTLTVSTSGTGIGTITSQPSGIQCGDKCADDFVGGSVVQLNATPSPGSVGVGWFGDCAQCGSNALCEISMDSHKDCTHVFISGLKTGWNLVGLIGSMEMGILDLLGSKKALYTSLWKWTVDDQGKDVWAVYLPNADKGGEAYASAKGFLFLQSIKPGEGFWVHVANVQENEPLALIGGGTGTVSSLEIQKAGWSLVTLKGVKDKPITQLVANKEDKIVSVWKWLRDEANPMGKWGVYLPGKPDAGLSYAQTKGFALLDSLKVGEGFWVYIQKLSEGMSLKLE